MKPRLMRVLGSLMLLCLAFLHLPAQKGNTIRQAPVPSWVVPVVARWNAEVPQEEVSEGIHTLLHDMQHHQPLKTHFRHRSEKVLNEMGLETFSEVRIDHDPAYQQLDIHYLRIYRDGKFLDRLKMDDLTVLQMERRSDRHLYDGALSALIFIEDLRVGDIIDYAYSLRGENPILEDHAISRFYLTSSIPMDQLFCREILPATFGGKFRYENGAPAPKESSLGGLKVYDWHAFNVSPTPYESNVPYSYCPYQFVELSDFGTWDEVHDHVEALFRKVDWAGPEIKLLADSLARSQRDSTGKALAALRFVQDQVRYLGMEGGINGFQPHPSQQTLQQRFGDCKDKSILLVGLLRTMGMNAWPVLVNTSEKGEIADALPHPLNFDHCVVKLRLEGEDYWLDPTIRNQGGNLKGNARSDWGKGLVISEGKEALQTIPPCNDGAHIQITENWEIGKVGEPVSLTVETVYLGQEADIIRSRLLESSTQDLEKAYLNYFAGFYGKIERIGEMKIEDQREGNRLICTETYKLLNPWSLDSDGNRQQSFEIVPSVFYDYIHEVHHPNRKQPWALEFPLHVESHIIARFPTTISVASEHKKVEAKEFSFSVSAEPMDDLEGVELHFSFQNHVAKVDPDDFQEFAENMNKAHTTMVYRVDESTYSGKSKGFKFGNTDLSKLRPLIFLGAIGAIALLVVLLITRPRRRS
jgi:hypothetical protein